MQSCLNGRQGFYAERDYFMFCALCLRSLRASCVLGVGCWMLDVGCRVLDA